MLEHVGRRAIRIRVDRRQLRATKDARGRLMIRLTDLSPAAQERWRQIHGEDAHREHFNGGEELLASYPEKLRQDALARLEVINRAPVRGRRRWFEGLNGQRPPGMQSYRSFLRWCKRLQELGVEGLVDMRGRVRREAMDDDTKALIAGLYLQDSRPDITQVYEYLKLLREKDSLPVPSINQVRRFITREIPHAARVRARHGREAYDAEMPYTIRDYDSAEPGEIFCSDHTQLDVAVRHPKNGKPFFPWITAVMDIRSRKLVGWWVDDKPSGRTIAAACRRALLRFSPPKVFMCDNGRDYSSRFISGGQWRFRSHRVGLDGETEGLLTRLGVKMHFTLPYRGRSKPIERFFKRQKEELLRLLPGYRGGSVSERPERLAQELKSRALLSMADLSTMVDDWAESYNRSPHQGQGMNGRTPDQVFNANGRTQNLVNPNTLTLLMMPAERRLVYRNGIQFMGSWYYDTALEMLRREYVEIRYDPREAGRVAVFDMKGGFICWAARRGALPFDATAEEIGRAMREEKALEKSARDYIRHARSALNREELLSKIIEDRRRRCSTPTGRGHTTTTSQSLPARRLHTDHDAAAVEMTVAREMDTRPAEPAKRRIFLPGEGYMEIEDDD